MRKSISQKILVLLVIMVIIDCACGDTLNSLIRRRKKIKKPQTTTTTTEMLTEEIKEELPKQKKEKVRSTTEAPKVQTEEVLKYENSDELIEPPIKYIPLVDDNGDDIKVAASIEKKEVIVVDNKVEDEPKEEVKVEEIPKEVEEEVNKERIVTEWMLFRAGVPVDYSYNETAINPGDIVSSRGCPKSVDDYPWVLYETLSSPEPKCYLVGQTSTVCQGSAVMNYQRGNEYGVCACNFQECLLSRGLPLTPPSSDLNLSHGNLLRRRNGLPGKLRYRFCRPVGVTCEEFVYDQKEKRCDIMFSQGPCRANEWLQRNSKGGVECSQRLCEEGSGLSEKSELFQRTHGNVTEDNAECCRPWGGFSVASVITTMNKLNCDAGQIYSETLKKCLTPFRSTSLTVG